MAKKVFVDDQGFFSSPCPRCQALVRQAAAAFRGQRGAVPLTCPTCGTVQKVEIEFRKGVRKEVLLDGTCIPFDRPRERLRILVRDLSLEGCQFEALVPYPFRPEERIEVEFHLDDPNRIRIRKTAVVRAISGSRIGCQFQDPPGAYDPDLGFYLRN